MEIAWKFEPLSPPHFSSMCERLVQCTLKTLKAVLKDRVIPKEALRNAVLQVEDTSNSGPITHVSSDVEILKHSLQPCANPSHKDANLNDRTIDSTRL